MSDHESEIEFLEEDADLVQQCITTYVDIPPEPAPIVNSPLLVERKRRNVTTFANKRRRDDDDEDYDPREETAIKVKKKSQSTAHKKIVQPNPVKTPVPTQKTETVLTKIPQEAVFFKNMPISQKVTTTVSMPMEIKEVKPKLDTIISTKSNEIIRLYDYNDPPFIQHEPFVGDKQEMIYVKEWNELCLRQKKVQQNTRTPESSAVALSSKHLILRNVANNLSGKTLPTVWSRMMVQNQEGKRKMENFEIIIPNFSVDKIDIKMRSAAPRHNAKKVLSSSCVLLTKEEHRDGEVLVAYKPHESSVSLFKMQEESSQDKDYISNVKYLDEKVQSRVCAVCFQYSWRGSKKEKLPKKQVKCTICNRNYVNTYNLLTHLKMHSSTQVKQHKEQISQILAQMVGYHYKCRICQKNCDSIKKLRKHLMSHKGTVPFYCEVGNHVTI